MKWGLIFSCLFWITELGAEEAPENDFSLGGLLFGDFYGVPSHHLEEGDGAAGAVLRRGYLTADWKSNRSLFARARLEINQSGEFETYTFETRFKDLYLGWKTGRQRFLLGLAPTPTFDLIESAWGFRYLARTPMDLQGVPSRDTGISASGPINPSGSLSYRAMLGTGLDFGADSDENPKIMTAITWRPADNWTLDLYTDYEKIPGPVDRKTLQVFLAYQAASFGWGMQYSNQDREQDPPLKLASAFFTKALGGKTTLVGRVDRLFEPSPKGNDISYLPFDPSARATMFIAGIEFKTGRHLSITPNTVVTRYDRNDQGTRPKTDFYLRLTLFINFE